MTVVYDLADDIPMDKSHTLEQLTGRFQAIRDGLPELPKNSKDQYCRRGVSSPVDRQILILASTHRRRLGVLDFAGAGSEDFESWKTWSSRAASRAEMADQIEGGHGNGGKAFMARGADALSYMASGVADRLTQMGFDNRNPEHRYKPGYALRGRQKICGLRIRSVVAELERELSWFDASLADLPLPAQDVFARRQTFTIVVLDGVREWAGCPSAKVRTLAEKIPELLRNHGQMALTIETCQVWCLVDGVLITPAPLEPVPLDPYPGFEKPVVIPVPDVLIDPETGQEVSTGEDATRTLTLFTSNKPLRLREETRSRNVIRVKNRRNVVASWALAELVPQAASSYIYGQLSVAALRGHHLANADRSQLADTPLTRALRSFTAAEAEALAERIQKTQMLETRIEERARTSEAMSRFRELMRDFLAPLDTPGPAGEHSSGPLPNRGAARGDGVGGNGSKPKFSTQRRYGKRLDELTLERGRAVICVARGTRVPLLWRGFEVRGWERFPLPFCPVDLIVDKAGALQLDAEGGLIARRAGTFTIRVQSREKPGVVSEPIRVEVIEANGIEIDVPAEPLHQGEKRTLPIRFLTSGGIRTDVFVEAAVTPPRRAALLRSGILVAGNEAGEARLTVRFGPGENDVVHHTLLVGDERVQAEETTGGGAGGNIPEILLCGETAPGMEEYPPTRRTFFPDDRLPSIIEDGQFPNVVWINHLSKEACRVRQRTGGSGRIGGIATRSFLEFIAGKCFEVLKRLKVRQDIRDRSITEPEFCQLNAEAEVECADFVEEAYNLAEQLLTREEARG